MVGAHQHARRARTAPPSGGGARRTEVGCAHGARPRDPAAPGRPPPASAGTTGSRGSARRSRCACGNRRRPLFSTRKSSALSTVSEVPSTRTALGPQRVVEDLDHLVLHVALQVDEQVAAADQVEPREGRVAEEVVRREDHPLAYLLPDPVSAVLAVEEAAQARRAHVGLDVAGVEPLARPLQRALVQVRGEDLDRAARPRGGRPPPSGGSPASRPPRPWRSPTLHTRTRLVRGPSPRRVAGTTSAARASQTSGSRKKLVTVIRRSSASACTSSALLAQDAPRRRRAPRPGGSACGAGCAAGWWSACSG